MTEFGVFYQVYKNHRAVRFVLENFRKHFPDNPVILISDGGDDFTYMADEFNCKFFMRENIFGDDVNMLLFMPGLICFYAAYRLSS